MKINNLALIHFYALICFATAPLITSTCKALNPEQETNVLNIMKEFLDLNKNPNKSFESYATDLMKILQTDPKFTQFYLNLNKLLQRNCKSANLWGIEFQRNRGLMPQAVIEFIKKYRKPELIRIFNQRLNIQTRSTQNTARSAQSGQN